LTFASHNQLHMHGFSDVVNLLRGSLRTYIIALVMQSNWVQILWHTSYKRI